MRPVLRPLPGALQALTATLRAIGGSNPAQTARLGRTLATDAAPVLSSLNSADLPFLLSQFGQLAVGANAGDRLVRLINGGILFLQAVRTQDLIRRTTIIAGDVPGRLAAIQHTARIQARTLAVQRQSLAAQRQSLAAQRQSLAVQRTTLALLRQSLSVQQRRSSTRPAWTGRCRRATRG